MGDDIWKTDNTSLAIKVVVWPGNSAVEFFPYFCAFVKEARNTFFHRFDWTDGYLWVRRYKCNRLIYIWWTDIECWIERMLWALVDFREILLTLTNVPHFELSHLHRVRIPQDRGHSRNLPCINCQIYCWWAFAFRNHQPRFQNSRLWKPCFTRVMKPQMICR